MRMFAEVARVYYNRMGQHPWSVDCGIGSVEISGSELRLIRSYGVGKVDPAAPEGSPRAWIEFTKVWVNVGKNGDIIIES